jgi:class 3 adenylate cyclase
LNPAVDKQLPAGTVTFLFTDIEGSTELMRDLGDGYGEVLDDSRRLLREHLGRAGGREIDTQGDAFFFSFTRARDAVGGAVAAQRALTGHKWHDEAPVRGPRAAPTMRTRSRAGHGGRCPCAPQRAAVW